MKPAIHVITLAVRVVEELSGQVDHFLGVRPSWRAQSRSWRDHRAGLFPASRCRDQALTR
jgi:hypothetical protein